MKYYYKIPDGLISDYRIGCAIGEFDRALLDEIERDENYVSEYTLGCEDDIARADPDLVAVIEELGAKANGRHADLKVVEIPDGIEWEIDEYDGIETIHEIHRSWG